MAKKTILITGVNGFLGSHIAVCLADSHRVVGIDSSPQPIDTALNAYYCMALPRVDFVDFINETKPDAVVHCAGSASVPFSVTHPETDFNMGPGLVIHILDALRKADVSATFIFPSSAAVYGNPEHLPIKESDSIHPISPYGHHKAISERIIQEYQQIYGIPFIIMRIFSCYGTGLRKQLLWDICKKIDNGKLQLYGTGQETRDFIHGTDVANFVKMCLLKKVTNLTVNIAYGKQISVLAIANLLLNELGSDILPRFSAANRPGDPLYWEADVSLMKKLGFHTEIKIEAGIRQYANWFKNL